MADTTITKPNGPDSEDAPPPLLTRPGLTSTTGAAVNSAGGGIPPLSRSVGAMVNGVQTFNDATVPKSFIDSAGSAPNTSDTAGPLTRPTPSGTFNGRTYSGAELGKLADSVNTVPSENFIRPGVGTLGAPVSPGQGLSMAAQNIARPGQAQQDVATGLPIIQRPSSYDPEEAAGKYQSDMASIINKDPRSISGIAAHNARADLVWGLNTARNKTERAAAVTGYQTAMGGLADVPGNVFTAQNQAGIANARDLTQWADTANRNAANVSRAGLMADSRLGAAAERADAMNYGADARADAMRYAADTRGNAQINTATINANRPRTNAAFEHGSSMAYANGYTQAIKNGMTPDQAIDYAQKSRAAFERRNDQQKQNQPSGANSQRSSTSGGGPQAAIPQGAIDLLKKNPHKYADFDSMFGAGAAARYLGPSGG